MSSQYTYDPATKKWNSSYTPDNGKNNNTNNSDTNKNSNLTSSSSNKNDSAGKVEKQYNNIEMNTLVGTLSFIVTHETIKLRAGDTIEIKGIGKYLSGKYYVKDITRQISSSGYSHTATVIKTDFGKSLKMSTNNGEKNPAEKVQSSPQASNAKRTYTVKKGDCLWNIAKQFYGSGADYTKIYDANTNQVVNPNLIYPGQVLIIP